MKRAALFILLLFATLATAASGPDEYTIDVHVTSTHWAMKPNIFGVEAYQELNVIIDGKKYELAAITTKTNLGPGITLLALGDYRAKLVLDVHKNAYESSQAYELLFPDKKTKKFFVVGQTE